MNSNSVTALSEADATGEIAEIFADIRRTMEIPLLTSIWRILAGHADGLPAVWNAVRPLYATGQPEAALARLRADAEFPAPAVIQPGDLESANVSQDDLPAIRSIVGAYNRSNALNLLTQSAIVVDPSGKFEAYAPAPPPDRPADLPVLLERDEIDAAVWNTVLSVNRYGAQQDNPGLATFYRHLAYWPGLLELIDSRLAPLRDDGTIERCAASVFAIAQQEASRMAHLRDDRLIEAIPADAYKKVATYVSTPLTVTRIVSIGHGIARWLDTAGA